MKEYTIKSEYKLTSTQMPICTINLNGVPGRQLIYWDTTDKLLHSDHDDPDEENPEYRCNTLEDAIDTARDLYERSSGWDLEWID